MRNILQIDSESSHVENISVKILQSQLTPLFPEIPGVYLEKEFQAEAWVDLASRCETHQYCHTLFLQFFTQ